MNKIISLFQRNYESDRLVRDEVVPGAEWVLAGEGIATRKLDGTACRVSGDRLWKRFDAKRGKEPPVDFEAAQDPDPVTGHWPGWVPVGLGPEDRWHREAWALYPGGLMGGTYELIGPKVQGNPEHLAQHELLRHGEIALEDVPRDFVGLRAYLEREPIEGIVWHHPDGRMVKIKAKDFAVGRGARRQRNIV